MTTRTDQELATELRAMLAIHGHAHVSTLAADTGETEARVADVLRRMSGEVYLGAVTLNAWSRRQYPAAPARLPSVAQEPNL
jgi:hypothetical protein